MKKFVLFFTPFLFLLACQISSTINVGMVVSATGQYSPLLVTARNGAILAVEEMNAQGGPQFELLVMDDKSSKEEGKSGLTELIDSGIELIVLSVTSGSYAELEELVTANDLLVISPTVSSDLFKGKDDNLIRMAEDVSGYAGALANYTLNTGSKHTVLVYDSNNLQYGLQMVKNYEKSLKDAGSAIELSVLAFDSTEDRDFNALSESIAQFNGDTVFFIASPFDAALLCQAVSSQQYLTLLSPWSISDELIENGGKTVEGAIFYLTDDFTAGESPSLVAFKERYYDRFGQEATYQSTINYDALLVLRELILQVDEPTPQKLKEALLRQSQFQGIHSE